MKFCWDNLEKCGVHLNKRGNLVDGGRNILHEKTCIRCGEKFLAPIRKKRRNPYCSINCANFMHITKLDLPLYNVFAPHLNYAEEIRAYNNENGLKLLQVRCSYCNQWFIPTRNALWGRIKALKGTTGSRGELRFYCSTGCKKACPIYGMRLYPRDFNHATSRETQPELRQMVLERDNWTCQKCGRVIKDVQLHCHHIDPQINNPIESADIDNCITLCIDCHKEAHSTIGCRYQDLKCK